MEFTKGEWRVVTDATGHTHIMAFDNGFERNVCALSIRSPEQEIANARLIASAPDLYEACKDIRQFLRTHGYNTDLMDRAIAKVKEV